MHRSGVSHPFYRRARRRNTRAPTRPAQYCAQYTHRQLHADTPGALRCIQASITTDSPFMCDSAAATPSTSSGTGNAIRRANSRKNAEVSFFFSHFFFQRRPRPALSPSQRQGRLRQRAVAAQKFVQGPSLCNSRSKQKTHQDERLQDTTHLKACGAMQTLLQTRQIHKCGGAPFRLLEFDLLRKLCACLNLCINL